MIIPSERRSQGVVVALFAAVAGLIAAVHYYRLGLTLSHYDARGHLVVARRIVDSITPGWQQIGAVWLPLPHLLNALPIQVDLFYRTGISGVALSLVAHAVAAVSIFAIVRVLTGSIPAAATGAALFALNPNVLYLQATPMTEPLLIGLCTAAVAMLLKRVSTTEPTEPRSRFLTTNWIGFVFALACLTRYEAWPITVCALVAAAWAYLQTEMTWREVLLEITATGIWPLAAILGFMAFSRVVIGEWFVSGGFFVPDNPARDLPLDAALQVLWGSATLSGSVFATVGIAAAAVTLMRALIRRTDAPMMIPIALFGSAALPWLAFLDGHPYRIRYMVPLIAAQAIAVGVLAGTVKRTAALAAAVMVALVLYARPPLDSSAAMVLEAQWDRPNVPVRQAVSDFLKNAYHGETIMASMGSLGHYMQELSASGLQLRDFLHEGNGDIWLRALDGPHPFVGWILIEEKAEGGDMLAKRARENPSFLNGFTRVSEGAGVALYARQNRMLNVTR